MYCKHCDNHFEGDLTNCPNCGKPIDVLEEESSMDKGQVDNTVTSEKETMGMVESEDVKEPSINNIFGNPHEIEEQKKNSKKNLLIISIISVLIIGSLAFALTRGPKTSEEPFDQLVNGYKNTFMADQVEMETVLTFKELDLGETAASDANVALVTSMIKDIQVTSNIKQDREDSRYEINMLFSLRDIDLITMNLYLDTEGVAIKLPELYEKQFFVTWEGLSNFIKEEAGVQISFAQYIDLLTSLSENDAIKNFDETKLIEVLRTSIVDDLVVSRDQTGEIIGQEIEGDMISINLNQEDLMNLFIDLLQVVVEDEQFKEIADDIVNSFVDILESSGDAHSLQLSQEDLDNMRNAIDEIPFDEVSFYQLQSEEGLDDSEVNYQYDFYLNGDEILGYVQESIISATDSMTSDIISITLNVQTLIKSVNKSIDFIGLDKENGIDLANITEEEMEDILLEIQGNAMSQFIFNPDLQEILGAGY